MLIVGNHHLFSVAEGTDRSEGRQTATAAGETTEEKQQGHEDVISRVHH